MEMMFCFLEQRQSVCLLSSAMAFLEPHGSECYQSIHDLPNVFSVMFTTSWLYTRTASMLFRHVSRSRRTRVNTYPPRS